MSKPNPSIQFVRHANIDSQKWDLAVMQSRWPIAYAFFNYLNAVCENQWDALIFKDYEAVFPLPFKKKLGLKYLIQPVFCQQLGAFGSNAHVNTLDFLHAIPKYFFRVRLQINPYFDHPMGALLSDNSINKKGAFSGHLILKTNLTIRLSQPLNYNKDCQKNLQRIAEHKIEYKTHAVSFDAAIEIYKNAWGEQNESLGEVQFKKFSKACTPDNSFTISAHHPIDDSVLGAAIFLISPENPVRCIHYVCAGPTEKGRSIGIMHGIVDHVIRQYHGQNILFDFEGSSIASVASFYKKFGAIEDPFFCFQRGF